MNGKIVQLMINKGDVHYDYDRIYEMYLTNQNFIMEMIKCGLKTDCRIPIHFAKYGMVSLERFLE